MSTYEIRYPLATDVDLSVVGVCALMDAYSRDAGQMPDAIVCSPSALIGPIDELLKRVRVAYPQLLLIVRLDLPQYSWGVCRLCPDGPVVASRGA